MSKSNTFTHGDKQYKVLNGNLYEVTDHCLIGARVTNDGDLRTKAKAAGWTGNIEDKVEIHHVREARKQISNHISRREYAGRNQSQRW